MSVHQQEGIVMAPVVPNAHITVIAFVTNYYNFVVLCPHLLYTFYKDYSILSRPAPNNQIPKKVDIKTIDSQASYKNGVLVLVCGSVTFKTNETRTFSQSFFLAPGENGYFILNDIFRYVGEEPDQPNLVLINGRIVEQHLPKVDLVSKPSVRSEAVAQDQKSVIEQPTTVVEEPAPVLWKVHMHQNSREVPEGSTDQNVSTFEHVHREGPPAPAHPHEIPVVVQNAPEKSFALSDKENAAPSIVALVNESPPAPALSPSQEFPDVPQNVPENSYASSDKEIAIPSLVALEKLCLQSKATNYTSTRPKASSTAKPICSTTVNMTDKSAAERNQRCVFISNLPADITPPQVKVEFKKFGTIKPSGVQVRSTREGRSSYAFVEFEAAASVQAAIHASPMPMGPRRVFINAKRPSREEFSYDSTRGRGGYFNGDRGNGRSDLMNRNGGGGGSLSGRRADGIQEIRNGGRGAIMTSKGLNPST